MKITRKQLRRLIEASVIKRGRDYVAPVEAPLKDPRDFDFDLSDENKKKFFDLAGGDDASQAQADVVADALDFPKSGRFGADTFSKQMKMYDMGLDVINDSEVDQLLDRAIELYFNDYGDYLADDLFHVLQAGYKYPEGPGGFQLFLNGDPNFNKEDLNTELDVTFFHPKTPAIRTNMVYAVMRKMYVLINIKITGIQDAAYSMHQKKRFEKFKKAEELFKKITSEDRPPALTQHVYDKMMKPMYKIYTAANSIVYPEQDMSKMKESKIRLSKRQLRRLIEGLIKKKGDYTIPVEDPLPDPLKDLDYNEDQKSKLKMLAMSDDEENQTQADFLADVGDYQSIDRFGVDTFSQHVQAEKLGVGMLTDPDIDSAITRACDNWIYEEKDYLSYIYHIEQDSFKEYVDFMIRGYDHDSIIEEIKIYTTEVLDKRIESLNKISNSAAPVPSVDEKVAYYENAKKLFSPDHDNPIVAEHVMDKFTSVLYPFYLDWKKYYMSGERDIPEEELTPELKAKFANIKEGRR